MDKTVIGGAGTYPGLLRPTRNQGGVFARDIPGPGTDIGMEGGMNKGMGGDMGGVMNSPMQKPEIAEGDDLTPIFIEWAFGKAAEAQANGNDRGGKMIAQGIQMILQGLGGAGELGEGTLARQQIGGLTTNIAVPPPPGPSSPMRGASPLGGGSPVPPLP